MYTRDVHSGSSRKTKCEVEYIRWYGWNMLTGDGFEDQWHVEMTPTVSPVERPPSAPGLV